MIKVRLWVHDYYVDLTIKEDEYSRLLSWATVNEIEVYRVNGQ